MIAIPTVSMCILGDSLYFGGEDLTITSLNFLRINVVEGLSKYFGEEPLYYYVWVHMPVTFTIMYPIAIIAYYVYYKDVKSK